MFNKNLTAASAKALILSILQRGKNYGYAIISEISELSDGQIEWAEGSFYPVLHKMEKDGLLSTEWVKTDDNRPRKYYSITERGKEQLKVEQSNWISVHNILMKLWTPQIS